MKIFGSEHQGLALCYLYKVPLEMYFVLATYFGIDAVGLYSVYSYNIIPKLLNMFHYYPLEQVTLHNLDHPTQVMVHLHQYYMVLMYLLTYQTATCSNEPVNISEIFHT